MKKILWAHKSPRELLESIPFNPEILSTKATHTYKGIKVKLFTGLTTAEIMEGPDKGKWTTVEIDKLVKL